MPYALKSRITIKQYMKNFLLTAAALIAAAGMNAATGIQMYMGESPVAPGTYVCNDIVIDPDDGVIIDPKLSVVSAEDVFDVTITAECTSGQKIQMCCGGQCEIAPKVVKSGLELEAGVAMKLDFEYKDYDIFKEEDVPEKITTNITVELDGEQDLYTIVMNDKGSGIAVVAQDKNVYATPDGLVYNVSGNCDVTVYDINGHKVLDTVVKGAGTLYFGDLGKGIYLYRINGSANVSGKVMVK